MQRGILLLTPQHQAYIKQLLIDQRPNHHLLDKLTTVSEPATLQLSREDAETILDLLPPPSNSDATTTALRSTITLFIQQLHKR